MKYRKYKDFQEAFLNINREILLHPEIIDFQSSSMCVLDGLIIDCENKNLGDLTLDSLAYKKTKFKSLVNIYLGEEKIEELKHLGENTSGLIIGFDFQRKTTHNGSCIREIFISRENRNKPWNKINIVWRTAELQRRWLADLFLIYKIMEIIPNSKFEKIRMVFNYAYQNCFYVIPFIKPIFKINLKELEKNKEYYSIKYIFNKLEKYFKPENPPGKLLNEQRKYIKIFKDYEKGMEYKEIDINNISLF